MMFFTRRLVSPKLPTALATRTHVDLPGYELWLHDVDNVHVLPIKLDLPRFEEALSNALQLYPHVAGLLRCDDGRWSIELTNTAVPVDIDYKLDTNSGSFLDGDWVIQDDLSPFLSPPLIGVNFVNSGAPLLRLKLTFFEDETCIGVSWHHTLGDAIGLSRFMHTLSQIYQGLPLQYAPSFKKYHFPTPSRAIIAEFWPRMPHLHDTCSFSELENRIGETCDNVEHLRWRFDTRDLAELRSTLSVRGRDEASLSKQDCLTAYLTTILNHNRNILVKEVVNASSFRHVSAPFVNENVAGTLVIHVPTTIPTDMAGIATALRRAFIRYKEPDYIQKWLAVASNHMLETANAGKLYFPHPRNDVVTVNSNTVVDWHGAHFGRPDDCRFHTNGVAKLWLRCFKSNPAKGDDGVWRARQSVDISMGVTAELKPKLLETLSRGVQCNINNRSARL